MSNRFGILLYRWHSWVGLASGLFLIFICVTGSVAVFKPEIERAVDYGDFKFDLPAHAPDAKPIRVEQAIRTAEASQPRSRASSARFPARGSSAQSHDDTYLITLEASRGRRAQQVLVDPYQNKVLTTNTPRAGWGDFVRQLHVRFFYGSFWGRYVVGVFGIALLFSTVSGLMIFTRFNGRRWKPMFRRGRGRRIALADLHKIVGLSSVAFNIMFGLSGAVLGLEGVYFKYFAERTRLQKHNSVAVLATSDVQKCVDAARSLVPTGIPAGVGLNNRKTGLVKVEMVHQDAQLVRELSSYVVFDAKSLKPIETYDASKAAVGVRLYYAMEPLHFGRLGGSIVVKLLWGLMGLTGGFLSISGFAIFVLRQRMAWRNKREIAKIQSISSARPEQVPSLLPVRARSSG